MHSAVFFHIIADSYPASHLILRGMLTRNNDFGTSLLSVDLIGKKYVKSRRLFSVCRLMIPDLFDSGLSLFFIVFYDPVILKESGCRIDQRPENNKA